MPVSQQVTPNFRQKRIRSPKHLARLRKLPCSIPGCRPYWQVVAHHLTCSPQPKARGLTAGDDWAVPLCLAHHGPGFAGSLHDAGNERSWWARKGIDPLALAERLWDQTQEGT